MKTRRILIVIAVVLLLSVPVPAFAMESFKGLVPMTVDGLWAAGTNLPTGVEAVLPQNALKTLGGGVEYACVAKDAVVGTAEMMINGFGYGVWTAATNLDVAVVAVATRPHELPGDGADFVLKCAGGILRFVFGPPR